MKAGMNHDVLLLLTGFLLGAPALSREAAASSPSREEVNGALRKAVRFYRQEVSTEGGYLWQYSGDLQLREGEGRASATQVWVQSPGTPRVGSALLEAYRRTGESYLLNAARDAAMALVRGQLLSGGWDYRIEFDPQRRRNYAYRVSPANPEGRNTTTLDDDNTQSALRFLMAIDRQLDFKEKAIHDAVEYALIALLEAQYPNGAWPQRFSEPPEDEAFPVLRAAYPDSWSRTFPKPDYRTYYTFNDNTIADMIRTMLLAAGVYDLPRCREAAERAGDFILLAQLPDPQPAWAQQYDHQMHPAWARKFEPPAVTGGESQGVMRILLELYEATGKRKYLEPIPRAVKYLRQSRLPDGRLARFYELKTNKPLYFTNEYELTYQDDDLPTHYAFRVGCGLDTIARRHEQLVGATWRPPAVGELSTRARRDRRRTELVRGAMQAMDDRGAWVEEGQLARQQVPTNGGIIRSATFVGNITVLSEYMGR